MVTKEKAIAALGETVAVFGKFAPIVTVGLTKDGSDYALKVNFLEEPPRGSKLPPSVGGVRVHWVVTGEVVAH